jgi:hypothetical protein
VWVRVKVRVNVNVNDIKVMITCARTFGHKHGTQRASLVYAPGDGARSALFW